MWILSIVAPAICVVCSSCFIARCVLLSACLDVSLVCAWICASD